MDTSALKSFAPWARTALINEVTGRIAAVLGPASPERVEQPRAVAALEHAVKDAGGGDTGRAAVAEQVAYTWFNRIIALRFMDANGYTGIGVVSPQTGIEVGQPEILADAKAGNFDSEVVSPQVRDSVSALLDGTRRSADPQGEAYALLLTDYCRHWHRAMPFMFEHEGDFTELLIPANLLADESVLNRAVKVMTEEVCKDVEVIGWLYQFYISERKDEVFAGFKKGKKAGAAEIPAATQLFTPHWIVRYLVENSVGRLWMLNRPNSRLVDQMEYYIAPVDEETDFLKVSGPEELTVMDPACGSGHMLTYAFDLLYAIYEEEGYAPSEIPGLILTKNLFGTEIDRRAGDLAAFALAMKARGTQRAFFSKKLEPNICVLECISFTPSELDILATPDGDLAEEKTFWNQFLHADVFGALIQPQDRLITRLRRHLLNCESHKKDLFTANGIECAHLVLKQAKFLSTRYHALISNPPYMGNRNMGSILSEYASDNFPASKSDLFAMFVQRCEGMCISGAQLGFMTPFVWMFISSYEAMRWQLTEWATITGLIQLEYSGFDGATVPVCCFTFEKTVRPNYNAAYIKLSEFVGPELQQPKALEAIQSPSVHWFFRAKTSDFKRIPGRPIAYWLTDRMLEIFETGSPLSEIAEVKHGLSTGKNAEVVRLWWEVSQSDFGRGYSSVEDATRSRKKWFPYNKGGDYRRWFGNFEFVIRYDQFGRDLMSTFGGHRHDGKSHYFKEGITWTFISSSYFAARYTPAGSVFDVSGSSLFPIHPKLILGFLCSDLASEFLNALNPTLNFQVGNIKALPILAHQISNIREDVEPLVDRAISIHVDDWNSFETAWDFDTYGLVGRAPTVLADEWEKRRSDWDGLCSEAQELESANSSLFRTAYGLGDDASHRPPRDSLSLRRTAFDSGSIAQELVSYAVGCMFGRYSLDEPGLILADQGATLQDYLAKVPKPTFIPDADNVIPIIDGDWFEDDIVARFRQFLRAAFGEEHFEENLRFVTESLGVKDIRDYFVKSFYKDHVQRYKKRPIYWLFSSPKGSFNTLIYMHRYTPSTVSTVLNEYLREYKAKLKASLENQERVATGGGTAREQAKAQKEADRLRKVLLELDEYEHNVLYPLASQQIEIDLDDGVKANYPKFGTALKKIPGLEAAE